MLVGKGNGEKKEMRKKPNFPPLASVATFPPLASTPLGGWSGVACQVKHTGSSQCRWFLQLSKGPNLPDQVLGLDPRGLHPSPNDG